MKTINFAILPDLRKSIEITSKILATFDGEDRAYDMIQDHLGKLLALEMQILSNGISLEQKANVWYPDDSGWVEVPSSGDGSPPDGLSGFDYIEVLILSERECREWESSPKFANDWVWSTSIEFPLDRIVAYKLISP